MASSSSVSSPSHETLFNAAKVELYIPNASDLDSKDESEVTDRGARKVAFLDEKLLYFVTLVIVSEHLPSSSTSPPPELLRFITCLQLTANSSFIPPLPTKAPSFQAQQAAPPSSSTLAPPDTASSSGALTPSTAGLQPYTPNPFPSMNDGQGQYASSEGVTVWEGPVEVGGKAERDVSSIEGGWRVRWRGEVPIAYVRTQIQDPLLSITVSVTLRDSPQRSPVGHDDAQTDEPEESEEEDDLAGMEDIDLLGGLANGGMPTSRLAHSIQQDLSLPLSSGDPMTAVTVPSTAPTTSAPPNIITPSTTGPSRQRGLSISVKHASRPITPSTLRRSYRRVLSLSSGLRVRMRTLFLPQLLAPGSGSTTPHDDAQETHSERRVALCVEVENPLEPDIDYSFDIESVVVDVGGKGGKATAELVCQPEQLASPAIANSPRAATTVFPLRLKPVEQYNLLYLVSISSAPEDRSGQGIEEALSRDMGKGDEQRPVAIIVSGRPYTLNDSQTVHPTAPFQSRWNCTLDLAPFYASLTAGNLPPLVIPEPSKSSRNSKTISSPPNAIVGDKRFSLATLLASKSANSRPQAPQMQTRISSMASMTSVPGSRVASYAAPKEHSGLLISVKVLPPDGYGKVVALEAFSVEVFVHNRTEEVRRFRLSVPGREVGGRVREVWEKRRQRGEGESPWGVDDPILRQILLQHVSSSPALVPLENDVRCGPLYPGASMSARMRFLPLREGVHKLEKLRVTGVNEDFDFIMSPVLDVVVGSA